MGPPPPLKKKLDPYPKKIFGPLWIFLELKKNQIFFMVLVLLFALVERFSVFYMVPGPFSSLQFCTFLLLKIYRIVKCLEKLIGQWIPDRDGRGVARDIKKNYFHFQNATKNGNKVGTIYKVGILQLFKLSNLCYHFLLSFENGNNFFLISLAIRRPLRSGIH